MTIREIWNLDPTHLSSYHNGSEQCLLHQIDCQSYAPFSLAHEHVPIKLKLLNRKRKSIIFWQRTMDSVLEVPTLF